VAAQDRLQPRTSINSCREGRPGVAEESNNRTTTVYCKNGEASEACVRVIDSAAQSQYRSVDLRHAFKGKSQRIHALRIAACRPLGHYCSSQDIRSSSDFRLAGRSQPGPVLADFTHAGIARHGMSLCYTAISTAAGVVAAHSPVDPCTRVRGSPVVALIYQPFFLFSSTTFANAQHSKFPEDIHPCYRPPQYYKRLSITVRIGWQRPIEPTPCTEAITSGPRTAVSPFNKNVDISAQVLNARSHFLQKLHNNRFLTTPEQARPRRPRPAVQAHDPGNLNIEPSRLGPAECGAFDSHITTPCVFGCMQIQPKIPRSRACCPQSFLS